MAFMLDFIKFLLAPRSPKNQDSVTSEGAPASRSPIAKKPKSRSPSVGIPSVGDEDFNSMTSNGYEELDIVPSIEIDEVAEMEKNTSLKKKRKDAHKRSKSDHVASTSLNRRKRPAIDELIEDVDEMGVNTPLKKRNKTAHGSTGTGEATTTLDQHGHFPTDQPDLGSSSRTLPNLNVSSSFSFSSSMNGESDHSSTSSQDNSFITSTDAPSAASTSYTTKNNRGMPPENDFHISSKEFESPSDHAHILKAEAQNVVSGPKPPPSTPSSSLTKFRVQTRKPVDWSSPASVTREKAFREAEIAQKTAGWRPADAEVYREIRLRPLKPTLPLNWKMDFPGFPDAVFATNENAAFIKPRRLRIGGVPDFSGPYAFKKVFNSGIDVRGALQFGKNPSKHIKRATEIFIRWTLEDGGLRKKRAYLPLIEIQVGSEKESVPAAQDKLVGKMQELKYKWANALEDSENTVCPPIYGVLITHCVEAFIAPVDPDGFGVEGHEAMDNCRVLAIMDWSDAYRDIWNALAVAILAVHCRDLLLEFLEGRTLKGVEVEMDPPDLDA